MKETPLLMKPPLVRATLAGTKTVTRRICKVQPTPDPSGRWTFCVSSTERKNRGTWAYSVLDPEGHVYTERGRERELARLRCPYGEPGDRLWVRETWCARFDEHTGGFSDAETWYRATDHYVRKVDGDGFGEYRRDGYEASPWKPSIHMPRRRSRITLEIESVRIERLHDITEEDARAEGVDWAAPWFPPGKAPGPDDLEDPREVGYPSGSFALQNFRALWEHINGAESWNRNPYVWAISFRRI